jgi:hypothetical protein
MDHRRPVRVVERQCQITEDADGLVDRNAPFAREPIAQTFARHVLHDEVQQPVGFPSRIHGDDVGLPKARDGLGLLGKPLPDFVTGPDLGRNDLDGHRPIEGDVLARNTVPTPPWLQHALDPILPGEGIAESRQRSGSVASVIVTVVASLTDWLSGGRRQGGEQDTHEGHGSSVVVASRRLRRALRLLGRR